MLFIKNIWTAVNAKWPLLDPDFSKQRAASMNTTMEQIYGSAWVPVPFVNKNALRSDSFSKWRLNACGRSAVYPTPMCLAAPVEPQCQM